MSSIRVSAPINDDVLEGKKFRQSWSNFFEKIGLIAGNSIVYTGSGGTPVGVTVGASPFIYTATARGAAVIIGTVINVTLQRAGVSMNLGTLNMVPMATGDIVTVIYSAVPFMKYLPD